jgi:phosphopantothenoylcysteine decarboxylase/phosphopantothenate--cysteine ligase
MELAKEAYRRGADVTVVHRGFFGIAGINELYVESAAEMRDACMSELKRGYDIFISAAAISDFIPENPSASKIKSENELNLKLRPAPKLLPEIRSGYPEMTVIGFKAETGIGLQELVNRASSMLESYGLDLVVANDVAEKGIGTDDNSICLIGKESNSCHSGSKRELAIAIIETIAGMRTTA